MVDVDAYRADGPIAAAVNWLAAIRDQDRERADRLTHPLLAVELATRAAARIDDIAMAATLGAAAVKMIAEPAAPGRPLVWARCMEDLAVDLADVHEWGVSSRTVPVDPDTEATRFVASGPVVNETDELIEIPSTGQLWVVMRRDDNGSWQTLAYGRGHDPPDP